MPNKEFMYAWESIVEGLSTNNVLSEEFFNHTITVFKYSY